MCENAVKSGLAWSVPDGQIQAPACSSRLWWSDLRQMKAPSLDFRKIATSWGDNPIRFGAMTPWSQPNLVCVVMLPCISRERYMLWTRDLHHWIQQRWRFIKMCGSIVTTLAISPSHSWVQGSGTETTTPSALELWAPEINHISWVWLVWVNSCGIIISRTLHAMDMRLAPLDTTKIEVCSALELCTAALSTFMDALSLPWNMTYVSWRLQTINMAV